MHIKLDWWETPETLKVGLVDNSSSLFILQLRVFYILRHKLVLIFIIKNNAFLAITQFLKCITNTLFYYLIGKIFLNPRKRSFSICSKSQVANDTYILLFKIIVLLFYWGHIVTFTKVLTMYYSWIHPSIIFLYPPSPILGIVSTGFIFPFSYIVYTIFLPSYILSSQPYPLPLIPIPQTGSILSSLFL
jgi:hypothetical protein